MTDLTGHWSGTYVYPGKLAPVPFQAEFRDHGGRISGIIIEPAPPWSGASDAHAILSGERQGAAVTFVKVYDDLDHFLDPVDYVGALDSDECEISGSWRIGVESGGFIMTRPKSGRADVEQVETEEVRV